MRIEVIRQSDDGTQTLGDMFVLNDEGATIFKCDTLELSDLNNDGIEGNEKGKSCIPKSTYVCIKREATKAIPYKHILITGISGRDGVCIHKGNHYTQIRGCILVGSKEVDINADGKKDVVESGKTFDKLMAIMPDTFKLTIK